MATMRFSVAAVSLACLTFGVAASSQTIEIPAGQKVVLTAEGRGSQIYKCDTVNDAAKWVFVAPEAHLFANGKEIGTHGAGPMWTAMGGSIHGRMVKTVDSLDATSIPWLLLQATTGDGTGPLRSVTYIERSDTKGGKSSSSGCDAEHLGSSVRVPYTAIYTFYAAAN